MKIKIHKIIKHCFFLEEQDIKHFFDFLKKKYAKVNLVAICIDGTQLETDNIEEIINFSNPSYRKIKVIKIDAYNSYDERISIVMGDDDYSSLFFGNTAEFFITTSDADENVREIAQELIRMFREVKPFYDWIARVSLFEFILILLSVVGISVSAAQFLGLLPKSEIKLSEVNFIYRAIFIFTAIYLATYPFDRFRKQIFPKVFFNLGNQKRESGKIKQWRGIVFVTIILGIFIGLVVNFITKLFLLKF